MITEINKKNKSLLESKLDGFIHQGKWYIPTDQSITINPPNLPRSILHRSLYPDMDAYLAEEQALWIDTKLIHQTLFQLLDPCKTSQDVRDTLPECLVNLLKLGGIPRQREAAWSIQDNPRALRQYQKVLPTVEVYSVASLLY